MTTHKLIVSVIVGAVVGMALGAAYFMRKHRKDGEPFNRAKFTGTVMLSAGIGVSLTLSGIPVTPANVVGGITANAALLAMLEPLIKEGFREIGVFQNYSG